MPKKKDESEITEAHGRFEQEPMGGDMLAAARTAEPELLHYQSFIDRMGAITDSVVEDMVPIRTEPYHREPGAGSALYIDAHISARSTIDLCEKTKDPHIPKEIEDWYQPIYVHTYAVTNEVDSRGRMPMHSSADVGGYVIQVGHSDVDTVGFFVGTTDPAVVVKLHKEIVKDLCTLTLFDSNEMSFNRAKVEKFITKKRRRAIPMKVYDNFLPPQYLMGGKSMSGVQRSAKLGTHVDLAEEQPARYFQRAELKKEDFKARDYTRRLEASRREAERPWAPNSESSDIIFHGDMLDQRGGGRLEYKDERVLSEPGGAFVHVLASAGGDARSLDSHEGITSYIIHVGLPGNQQSIRMHTKERSLAQDWGEKMFNTIRYADDGTPPSSTPEKAVTLVIQRYKGQKSSSDPEKPFIEPLIG
jgi:hypothetical protein